MEHAARVVVHTDVRFTDEPFSRELFDEMWPLLDKHYREIARFQDIPLKPDFDRYMKMWQLGGLRLFIARDLTGEMVGYAVYFVAPNMHYSDSLQAVQDVLFIHPDRRGFGKLFIPWCDDRLRESGVEIVLHHVKVAHDFGPFLESIGYEFFERIFVKRLKVRE